MLGTGPAAAWPFHRTRPTPRRRTAMTRPVPAPPAYCRVTVLAPRANVDVALPADVPVADLVPMVLELVGEPAPGRPPRPWLLSGAAGGRLPAGPPPAPPRGLGGRLPAGSTLSQLGVLDGELLRIAPEGTAPVPPVFDDPVDALAATANPVGSIRRRCAAALVLVLAVAASALLRDSGTIAAVVAAAAARGPATPAGPRPRPAAGPPRPPPARPPPAAPA